MLDKTKVDAAVAAGVLNPVNHQMLLGEIEKFATRAGIAPELILVSAKDFLSPAEIKYLRQIPKLTAERTYGAILIDTGPALVEKMMVMCAALMRALVDARFMTVARVLEEQKYYGGPEATVLLIPNFYSPHETSKFDQQKAAALTDVIFERTARGMQTIIGVHDVDAMRKSYGPRLCDMIDAHFIEAK